MPAYNQLNFIIAFVASLILRGGINLITQTRHNYGTARAVVIFRHKGMLYVEERPIFARDR